MVSAAVSYQVARDTRLTLGVSYFDSSARVAYHGREGYGANLALETAAPLGTYEIGAQLRDYARHVSFDAPDPFIDPTRSREDNRWGAGVAFVLPIVEWAAIVAEYDYYKQNSNLRDHPAFPALAGDRKPCAGSSQWPDHSVRRILSSG